MEQGLLEYHRDWSGWTSLSQSENRDSFFRSVYTEKTMFPTTSDQYESGKPFEISIMLSKTAVY